VLRADGQRMLPREHRNHDSAELLNLLVTKTQRQEGGRRISGALVCRVPAAAGSIHRRAAAGCLYRIGIFRPKATPS